MRTLWMTSLFAAVLAMGCAKEQGYEKVYKESVFSKSIVSEDPNDPYVYVPSVGSTPKDVTASRSYWMGDEKLVTFKVEKEKLVVLQLPNDEERFSGNANNFSPVMEFSIKHKDYRCKKDQYGECSNREEERDIAWERKRFMQIDFDSLKWLEVNTLPEQLTNVFMKCFNGGKTTVRDVKLEDGAINIHVTKTWTAEFWCADLNSFDDLRNMAFTVDYHYSFVKLSKLASPNYKAVAYPFEDQNSFGFFTTEKTKLTADNRTRDDSIEVLMNRWNPERKEIVYYLNDAFFGPGKELVLQATRDAVESINRSFAHAGVDMKVRLEDGRGKDIGDIRNSFIIMVDDPQASGVIGYGPSVTNPRTGEILKAQTVMYYGTIKKFIQDTYDELLEEKARSKEQEAKRREALAQVERSLTPQNRQEIARHIREERLRSASTHQHPQLLGRSAQRQRPLTLTQATRDLSRESFNPARKIELSHWLEQLKNRAKLTEEELYTAQINEMSHNCFYHASLFNWSAAIEGEVSPEKLGISQLKPWNQLTNVEQEKVIAALLPGVWVPTLVHEIGHNLGLRHNFNGSEDKDNYYSASERRSLKISREVTFSSVMDYAHSGINQLSIMGRYDVAALRFAYARKVELKSGEIVSLGDADTLDLRKKTDLAGLLREYRFCTDEHVEVNPGCNRFDEGASLKEVAEFYAKTFHKNYSKRNLRNRRLNFNTHSGDVSYVGQLNYNFLSIRRFFEIYDRIATQNPQLFSANWDELIANAPDQRVRDIMISNRDFVQGLQGAADVAADFFLGILATPDLTCVAFNTQTQMVDVVPLRALDEDLSTCFDPSIRLANNFVITGEIGRPLNNIRNRDELPGALAADPSQITVRGTWLDKVFAMRYLTSRVLGISTFDDVRGNFLDYPRYAEKFAPIMKGLLENHVPGPHVVRTTEGSEVADLNIPIRDSYMVTRSMSSGLNASLGIRKVEFDLRELLLPMLRNGTTSSDDVLQAAAGANAFSVTPVTASTVLNRDLDLMFSEFRDEKGGLIRRYVTTEENLYARQLMQFKQALDLLGGVDRQLLLQILNMRLSNRIPSEIPEQLKPLFELDLEFMIDFYLGRLPQQDQLLRIFQILEGLR